MTDDERQQTAIRCPCGATIAAPSRPEAWTQLNTHQTSCGAIGFVGYEVGPDALWLLARRLGST